ncbi:MAG: enoyl-CoA hydratase, partial [Deltaproteobacteria bacterium]|nr:enoyl-CoA hydratase [Deltaproteobacteria bacterium]
SADEARGMGLINQVVKRDELEEATGAFIKPYLKLSAEVLRQTKRAIVAGLMDDLEPSLKVIEDIYLNDLMQTADANEGLQAFVDKRKPVWKNE